MTTATESGPNQVPITDIGGRCKLEFRSGPDPNESQSRPNQPRCAPPVSGLNPLAVHRPHWVDTQPSQETP